MCGIAGVYEPTGHPQQRSTLLRMAHALRHRGPDGVGLYLDPAASLGLVNTRLSIVDLAGGDQPIGNETGDLWVVQNGEIYNHIELRAELEALGHRFTTTCDTEVLVHGWEAWGKGLLPRLNGAFAFALWDRRERRLFVARDRLGIRPLFIAELPGGGIAFASEVKALLRLPQLPPRIDAATLADTFSLWGPLPDRSGFEGVRELAPGHWLELTPDRPLREEAWWRLRFDPSDDPASPDALADELLELLTDATRLRLRADVPVGAYLSGGLDSSIIAALTRDLTDQQRRSFAIGFEDDRFDEGEHQRAMAAELDTDLTRDAVGARAIAQALPRVVELAEVPTIRSAPAPLLRLSGLARENGFKVVLTGEGADEMFAGYNIFKETMVRRFWARRPDSELRPKLLQRLYPYLGEQLGRSGPLLMRFFATGLEDVDDPLYSHRLRMLGGERGQRLLSPAAREAAAAADGAERLLAQLPEDFGGWSPLGKAQHLEIHTFLRGYLLHTQGDRMLMGNSVEGRFPFLDHRVAEFAARLPDRLRLHGLDEKYLLREATKDLLPERINRRPKQPYRAPVAEALLAGDAPDWVGEVLSDEALDASGLFAPLAVRQLVGKAKAGLERNGGVSENDARTLMVVASAQLLHRRFVVDPEAVREAIPTRVVVGSEVEVGVAQAVG